jgi:DNA-binding MarR family transcriptional regulator
LARPTGGTAIATVQTLNPQIIGQTERALGALMNKVLATAGGTFPQWVALTIAGADDGIDRERLIERLADALAVDASAASAVMTELIESDLLRTLPGPDRRLGLSERGRNRHARIRDAIGDATGRLFGDAGGRGSPDGRSRAHPDHRPSTR